jgi:hypothetical protein
MLKGSQEGESQQKMQWERAKEMKSRCDLYREVWNELHSPDPETHKFFKYQCFQRGVVELKSLLERGVEWEALTWETFEDFMSHSQYLEGDVPDRILSMQKALYAPGPRNTSLGGRKRE